MKKLVLVVFLFIGCNSSQENNANPILPCGARADRCLNPTTIVFKGADGLNVVGVIADIKSVSINLDAGGTFLSKEFTEQHAVEISKQFNFAFPKEYNEQIANAKVTGFMTITFLNFDKSIEFRDFTIENGTIIRDTLYPEVVYIPSTPLTVDWLKNQN